MRFIHVLFIEEETAKLKLKGLMVESLTLSISKNGKGCIHVLLRP